MSASFEFESKSEQQTRHLGKCLGCLLPPSVVIALNGTLGTGKTRLVKAIGIGVGIDPDNINSPTFALCVPHHGERNLLHVDAYRIQELTEVDELGLDEWVEEGGVLVVEWADRIQPALPELDLTIQCSETGPDSRLFRITSTTEIGSKIVGQLKAKVEVGGGRTNVR